MHHGASLRAGQAPGGGSGGSRCTGLIVISLPLQGVLPPERSRLRNRDPGPRQLEGLLRGLDGPQLGPHRVQNERPLAHGLLAPDRHPPLASSASPSSGEPDPSRAAREAANSGAFADGGALRGLRRGLAVGRAVVRDLVEQGLAQRGLSHRRGMLHRLLRLRGPPIALRNRGFHGQEPVLRRPLPELHTICTAATTAIFVGGHVASRLKTAAPRGPFRRSWHPQNPATAGGAVGPYAFPADG
mmetsp:Transcript_61222/g.197987  ORF Transcript_61222/g.197987 Transcript_61222/m.197987 type:complete len:243 (+) Transcript_61222:517-1245(+)